MCVGQYSYLRVVVCCGDYILYLGENIVYTFFGCCTYYYNLPYTLAGVMLPVFISLSDRREIKLLLTGVGLLIVAVMTKSSLQIWSLLALIPLSLYDGTPGKYRMKWLFYLYYPLHLIVIYGIGLLV